MKKSGQRTVGIKAKILAILVTAHWHSRLGTPRVGERETGRERLRESAIYPAAAGGEECLSCSYSVIEADPHTHTRNLGLGGV